MQYKFVYYIIELFSNQGGKNEIIVLFFFGGREIGEEQVTYKSRDWYLLEDASRKGSRREREIQSKLTCF